ncbi:glycosyltransferase family 2 protein [Granulibacter bethesdensis]|uniref:glycosyltransferase n=1 Tax=Granulibacter bethesdensis TaxID=364410 RepID=UPI0009321095|nr:glycosyltransferase family 2 protein [Granulibacter bethesdensis]
MVEPFSLTPNSCFDVAKQEGVELTVVVPCYNERANVAPMVAKLDQALKDCRWEVLFVDDNSPDGTADAARDLARHDHRVRCIKRVGRRGLSSAVIEGALACSSPFVAVIDGDLQHDETALRPMLDLLRSGTCDVAVGSRHVEGGDASGLAGEWRHRLSQGGTRLAQAMLPVPLSDPMSGFFMMRQDRFEALAPRLTGQGFKILLDLLLASPEPLRIREVPCRFRDRVAGESKLNALVLIQFMALLVDKALHGVVPLRFLSFAGVGAIGLVVHLAVLLTVRPLMHFHLAQLLATVVAMAVNFELNNRITYADQRLKGRRLWIGRLMFFLVCGLGAAANIGIAQMIYEMDRAWSFAGATGAMIGLVWNYTVSATLIWRAR